MAGVAVVGPRVVGEGLLAWSGSPNRSRNGELNVTPIFAPFGVAILSVSVLSACSLDQIGN